MTNSQVNWLNATRPKTLPAAIAPVLLGSSIAVSVGKFDIVCAILCMLTAVTLQIACNFSNDYADGIKGTDNNRIGPQRLVASGLVSAEKMLTVSLVTYALACIFGLLLVIYTDKWWFIPLGALCVLAGWFYTAGKNPYGYKGYGELSVFIFFGIVATIGTVYLQTDTILPISVSTGVSIGMLSMAMLMINNIRDIENDKKSGKLTLATKLGVDKSKAIYVALLLLPFIGGIITFVYAKLAIFSCVTVIWLLKILKIVLQNDEPKNMILALKYTGQFEIIYAIVLSIAFSLKPITG